MTAHSDPRRLWLPVLALACWMFMFMEGHDVWHDTGRPDVLARLAEHGATRFDMLGFLYAFYGLFFVLLAHVIVTVYGVLRRR